MTITTRRALRFLTLCLTLVFGCSNDPGVSPSAEPAPASLAPSGSDPASSERRAPGRMVVHSAELWLSSKEVLSTSDEAVLIATTSNGFVGRKEATHQSDRVVQMDLQLRIPAEAFDEALVKLRRQGNVLKELSTGRDVTDEFSDIESRLLAKRSVEKRLLGMLDQTSAVEDMLAVEKELERIRVEVEQLEGRTLVLADQAAFGVIDLRITTPSAPPPSRALSAWSMLSNAAYASADLSLKVVAGCIVAAGLVPPLLPLLALWLLAYRRLSSRNPGTATA